MKPCPRCRGEEFIHIPDSLASACKKCGFVWVGIGDDVEPGATIGQWLEDVYQIPNTMDEKYDENRSQQQPEIQETPGQPDRADQDPPADRHDG